MAKQKNWYIGIDVGGTKIQASLCRECGIVTESVRSSTPRNGSPEETVDCILQTIDKVLKEDEKSLKDLAGIGIAVPGVVDAYGNVVGTPNMNLGGVALQQILEQRCQVPVAVGNDGNLGALGETWLGSGHGSRSSIGIFVGTGIGSGLVFDGNLMAGACDAAGEIGHMYMQMDGPLCGCGNHGCFEAVAGRLAIERDIRAALEAGETSMISDLMAQKDGLIRSGMLNQALRANDPLVTRIVGQAAKVIGRACLSVRHLIDPQTIILGGGVMESCGWFMMPIIQRQMAKDTLLCSPLKREVVFSALGDNAVALGALALARIKVGRSPFNPEFDILPEYPLLAMSAGRIEVKKKTFDLPCYIRADGKGKQWKQQEGDTIEDVLESLTEGGIETLIVGTADPALLSEQSRKYLEERNVGLTVQSVEQAIACFNKSNRRRAALFL